VGGLLQRSAGAYPDNLAVAVPGNSWTYAELYSHSMKVAGSLAALGVSPREHVGLLLPNGLEFAAAWFGISLAGAVIVPLNSRYKPPELRYAISHAELRCVITTDAVADYADFSHLLSKSFPDLLSNDDPSALELDGAPHLRFIVNLGHGSASWQVKRQAFLEKADRYPADERFETRADPESLAALVFTSGTTSHPKACMHTHQGLIHNWLAVRKFLAINADDAVWDPLPLYHGQGYGMMLAAVSAGAAFLTHTHFEPESSLKLMRDHRATILYPGFATIIRQLIEHPDFPEGGITTARSVLAITPRDLWYRSQKAFAPAIQYSSYGLQEAGGAFCFTGLDECEEIRRATCGHPVPGMEVRIVEPDSGVELPPETPGEILVRGGGQFSGYYHDPDATRAMVDNEGFIHTGDLGCVDEAGRIIFRDRIKSMLKVGGENVAPSEIEAVLLSHPAVIASVVVGIPNNRLDQAPAAFVQLREGEIITSSELINYCSERLARFKVPRLVRFVTEWPMSATKIQASKLREKLLEELKDQESGPRSCLPSN
jgi:acyl-CoA synthetase (AMP-forming)/AMP-acid ligase II